MAHPAKDPATFDPDVLPTGDAFPAEHVHPVRLGLLRDTHEASSPAGAPAPHRAARGLSVAEVLRAEALRGSTVIAGAGGLDRAVERLNVMEVPDILPWVKPRELLLTTGYPVRHAPQSLARLVTALDARGLSALGIKFGRYLDGVPAEMLAEADRLGFPVIRLPDDVAFDDILEQVLTDVLNRQASALARSEEVHHALVEIVLEGGGPPEVASKVADLLACPVMITTSDGRVLVDAGDPEDLARVYAGPCFAGSGRLRIEDEGAGLGGHPGLTGTHVIVPVIAGRVDHGRIAAFTSDGRLGRDDVHILERAATVAALALTKQQAVQAVESKYQGDFLRDLISGRVPADVAVTHAGSLGWDVDRPLLVLVAELDPLAEADGDGRLAPRPALERFAAAWQTVLRPRDPQAPVAGFNREVVAVLGAPDGPDIDRRVEEIVRDVRGDGGGGRRPFSTGVSRVCGSAAGLPTAYEQARTAVRVARRMHGPGAIAHFDRLGIFRLLSLVQDQEELTAFAQDVLGDLARREDAEAVDLRRTLEVLLETNLNVAETARALHFHYNTLRYRIAKLERILGPFTTDPNLRLSLNVALQVVQLRAR